MQKWDYFYEKPAEPCARMGCDTPAAIRGNQKVQEAYLGGHAPAEAA